MTEKLCGKWKLIYADNVAEYCDAIDSEEKYKNMALKLLSPSNDIVQEISLDAKTVTITTTMPGKTTTVTATLGTPFETQFLDGRPLTNILTVESNILKEEQTGSFTSRNSIFTVEGEKLKEEQTGSFTSSNIRYLDGDAMVLTMTAKGVTSTRKYQSG